MVNSFSLHWCHGFIFNIFIYDLCFYLQLILPLYWINFNLYFIYFYLTKFYHFLTLPFFLHLLSFLLSLVSFLCFLWPRRKTALKLFSLPSRVNIQGHVFLSMWYLCCTLKILLDDIPFLLAFSHLWPFGTLFKTIPLALTLNFSRYLTSRLVSHLTIDHIFREN